MVIFQRKRLHLKSFDNLQRLVKKFTLYSLSAPHRWGILELKDNYAHVISDLMERNKRVV